jgi:glycosyltransferase involved in cell wall biosynthesis
MRVVIGIPMYNEETVAKAVLDDILMNLPVHNEIQIVVVDDGSTDQTINILKQYRDIKIIMHTQRRGVSYTIKSLLEYCDCIKATHLLFFPGNYKIIASCIPLFIESAENHQQIHFKGSRFLECSKNEFFRTWKNMAIVISSAFVRMLSNLPITDLTCSARIFNVTSIKGIEYSNLDLWEYSLEQILTIILTNTDIQYFEIPVKFRYTKLRNYSYVSFHNIPSIIIPWIKRYMFKTKYINSEIYNSSTEFTPLPENHLLSS